MGEAEAPLAWPELPCDFLDMLAQLVTHTDNVAMFDLVSQCFAHTLKWLNHVRLFICRLRHERRSLSSLSSRNPRDDRFEKYRLSARGCSCRALASYSTSATSAPSICPGRNPKHQAIKQVIIMHHNQHSFAVSEGCVSFHLFKYSRGRYESLKTS